MGETPTSSCKGDSIGPGVATDHQSPKRAETVVPPNPAGNPTQHGWPRAGTRTHAGTAERADKPTWVHGLGPKRAWGNDRGGSTPPGPGAGTSSGDPPCTGQSTPADSEALPPANHGRSERWNPAAALGRRPEASVQVGVSHLPWRGRIAQEANAPGKARGYADVGTRIGRWRCESESRRHEHGRTSPDV